MKTGSHLYACLFVFWVFFFIVWFHGWLPLWEVKRTSGCEMQLFFVRLPSQAGISSPLRYKWQGENEWALSVALMKENEQKKEKKKTETGRGWRKLRANKKRNDERQNVRINRWKKVIKWDLICKWKRE